MSSSTAGIVRPARRPAGWIAPGPPPVTPPDRPELWPGPGEDLCRIAGDWRILQRTDGHRFSLDDLVTAHFAASLVAAKPPARLLDLGCGIGSVLLFLAWRFPAARCIGLEAQEVSARLARRSIAWNGIDERCAVRLGDFRDPLTLGDEAPFDLVSGTPPYFPRGTGTESTSIQRAPCRFEYRGGIEGYCDAAARSLAPEAPLVACLPAGREERVAAAAASAGLAIERWRDVVSREGKPPLISLFALRRTEHVRETLTQPPLVVRDARGRRTEEFIAVRADMGMPP